MGSSQARADQVRSQSQAKVILLEAQQAQFEYPVKPGDISPTLAMMAPLIDPSVVINRLDCCSMDGPVQEIRPQSLFH